MLLPEASGILVMEQCVCRCCFVIGWLGKGALINDGVEFSGWPSLFGHEFFLCKGRLDGFWRMMISGRAVQGLWNFVLSGEKTRSMGSNNIGAVQCCC